MNNSMPNNMNQNLNSNQNPNIISNGGVPINNNNSFNYNNTTYYKNFYIIWPISKNIIFISFDINANTYFGKRGR